MLKFPKTIKYKSPHLHLSNKGLKGIKKAPQAVVIKSKEAHLMSPQQREVCRRILLKPVKEEYGALKIRFYPNLSRSKKPLQTRMGKGKGKHDHWVAPLKKNSVLLEIQNVEMPPRLLKQLYEKVFYRLPVESKLIKKKYQKNLCMEQKTIIQQR